MIFMLTTWLSRLRHTLFPGRREAELTDECQEHLNHLISAHEARGLDSASARLAARRDFGAVEPMKEAYRDRAAFTALGNIFRDLVYAIRSLRQSPAFTGVAVFSLALGIGANSAIFSFVDAILLKQLPVPQPDRLVLLNEGEGTAALRTSTLEALVKRNDVFDGLFGTFPQMVSLSSGDTAEWVSSEMVTGQYFTTLRVRPALGRLFTGADVDAREGDPVCVISYDLWQHRFNGDPNVLEHTLRINGHVYKILGVTERGFAGISLHRRSDVEVPATRIADFMPAFATSTGYDWRTSLSWLRAMGRLKPGLAPQAAQVRLQRLFDDIDRVPKDRTRLLLADGSAGFFPVSATYGQPALVLLCVVVIVLVAACVNIANLLLARGQARAREFAIRLAVGGSRLRLIQQLMLESLLLCILGAIAASAVTFVLVHTLLAVLNRGLNFGRAFEITLDPAILAFTCAVTFLTAILFGLVPALQTTRPTLVPELKEGSAVSNSAMRMSLRKGLVVAQLTLSLVLLFAASLLTRTLKALETVDLGFEPTRVITLQVNPAANGHSEAEATRIYQELLDRTRRLPGVSQATLAAYQPMGDSAVSLTIAIPGFTPKSQGEVTPNFNFVAPGYFATLRQSLLAGRDFTAQDIQGATRVAIVNQHFSRHFFGRVSPVGRAFQEDGLPIEIIGVVRDAHEFGVRDTPSDVVYRSLYQGRSSALTLLAQVNRSPQSVIPQLRDIVNSIDKRMPVYRLHTLALNIEGELTTARILSYLSTLFAGLAATLAAVGFYGVISYDVTRRKRELGVRFALGATRRNISDLFLRESLVLVALGLALGVPAALAAVRFLQTLLFGLTAMDVRSLLVSASLLLSAACVAIVMPLWRASHLDPLQALRHE